MVQVPPDALRVLAPARRRRTPRAAGARTDAAAPVAHGRPSRCSRTGRVGRRPSRPGHVARAFDRVDRPPSGATESSRAPRERPASAAAAPDRDERHWRLSLRPAGCERPNRPPLTTPRRFDPAPRPIRPAVRPNRTLSRCAVFRPKGSPPVRQHAPKRNGSVTGLPHRHGLASYELGAVGDAE